MLFLHNMFPFCEVSQVLTGMKLGFACLPVCEEAVDVFDGKDEGLHVLDALVGAVVELAA